MTSTRPSLCTKKCYGCAPLGMNLVMASLSHLGGALRTCFEKRGDIDDVNRAISLFREALTLSAHLGIHINLYRESLHLGLALTETRKNEDVEEVIQVDLCQQSLVTLSSLYPNRYFSFMVLKNAYVSRYRVQFNPADLALAVENFRLASRHPTQGFPNRVQTSRKWVVAVEQYHHTSALEAYTACFKLLDSHLATRSLATLGREMPSVKKAVELVEQGRGQQWSLGSRLKTPVVNLQPANPNLAHNLLKLSTHVSNAAKGSAAITDRAAADRAAVEYRRLTTRWEAVVAEIRNIQGFSRFLLPPSYEDLQAAASYGPVVILIARKFSCSAIVVPTSGQPHHVPFPSVALADARRLKDDFAREIRHAALMDPKEPRKDLRVLLRKVWDEIMLPIVNVLQHVLKLRRRSRQMMKTRATLSFIAVGQSQSGAGQGTVLAAVESELELVHKLIPPNVDFTTLSGDDATRAGALDALQRNTWPYNSRFAMRDQPLILLDIMEKNAPQAEFAFLSAYHTDVGDEKTPDEVIHLAVGLQFSRFKSVIGTLWAVDDAVAKHVVETFYENMFKKKGVIDCTRAASALNYATNTVKNPSSRNLFSFILSLQVFESRRIWLNSAPTLALDELAGQNETSHENKW
ncbi:hypothetical protein DFH29DRAFT_877650 [Suillus ampliporus]|nr:hypothetical protein DFH29DRAFT_877650 [Suillus ampliporus]